MARQPRVRVAPAVNTKQYHGWAARAVLYVVPGGRGRAHGGGQGGRGAGGVHEQHGYGLYKQGRNIVGALRIVGGQAPLGGRNINIVGPFPWVGWQAMALARLLLFRCPRKAACTDVAAACITS